MYVCLHQISFFKCESAYIDILKIPSTIVIDQLVTNTNCPISDQDSMAYERAALNSQRGLATNRPI